MKPRSSPGTDHTIQNPAWLAYMSKAGFPNDEFWTLWLDWQHSEEKPPERLRELAHQRVALRDEFNRTWKRRK